MAVAWDKPECLGAVERSGKSYDPLCSRKWQAGASTCYLKKFKGFEKKDGF